MGEGLLTLTQVLGVDQRALDLGAGPPTPRVPPAAAAVAVVELAAGDVHLVQRRGHPLGQHARVVGVHAEAVLVAHDGLVHALLVALALVVGLWRKMF